MNGKLLEIFVHISKLEVDGSNWVLFKDCFAFAVATASLGKHINSTWIVPSPPAVTLGGPFLLTAEQMAELEQYEENKLKWLTGEAVMKQAIAIMIYDSLFIEIQNEVIAHLMWEVILIKWKQKLQMVTVDLHHKLQAEKCPEHGGVLVVAKSLQTPPQAVSIIFPPHLSKTQFLNPTFKISSSGCRSGYIH